MTADQVFVQIMRRMPLRPRVRAAFEAVMAEQGKQSPSVTDDAGTYGAVTGGNGRYVLPCGCVPPCEGHHEDES